ncbi:unnamed protein product [[Candida] boidinii]|uniref:Unnamed protein product n=1 Tax=Candida boidinii TaxID=5477 RepID=A0ACB5U3X8_CANBO|nr:unnamed protein product [[Candida] boidinii]
MAYSPIGSCRGLGMKSGFLFVPKGGGGCAFSNLNWFSEFTFIGTLNLLNSVTSVFPCEFKNLLGIMAPFFLETIKLPSESTIPSSPLEFVDTKSPSAYV